MALAVIAILAVITAPIGAGAPSSAPFSPGSSFYVIGPQAGALEIGGAAPDFVGADGTTLMDLDGRPVSLADLRGRPVWVFFWATWCTPCQQETPDIRDAWASHSEDVVILGIDVQEPRDVVDEYRQAYGLTYRIGLDTTATVMASYHVFGLPTHYFIDRNGIIRDRYFGPLTRDQMEQRIELVAGPDR